MAFLEDLDAGFAVRPPDVVIRNSPGLEFELIRITIFIVKCECLLGFARLFHRLSSPSPDREAIREEYYRKCYRVYDKALKAVDERPAQAASHLSQLFA